MLRGKARGCGSPHDRGVPPRRCCPPRNHRVPAARRCDRAARDGAAGARPHDGRVFRGEPVLDLPPTGRRPGAPHVSSGVTRLAISNASDSSLSREAFGALYPHGGPAIGVASTNAFGAQLAALAVELFEPFVFSVAVQYLAYHIAAFRARDADQPKNARRA